MKISRFREIVNQVHPPELSVAIMEAFSKHGFKINLGGVWNGRWISNDDGVWFTEGVNSEILSIGASGWLKGKMKLKVSVEFEPDEPAEVQQLEQLKMEDSEEAFAFPLDEIRQTLNGGGSIDG